MLSLLALNLFITLFSVYTRHHFNVYKTLWTWFRRLADVETTSLICWVLKFQMLYLNNKRLSGMNPNIYRLQNGYSPILPGAVHITLKSLRILLKINSEKFVQPISGQFSIFLPPETVGKTKVTLTFSGVTEIKYRHKMGEFSQWYLSYAKLVG